MIITIIIIQGVNILHCTIPGTYLTPYLSKTSRDVPGAPPPFSLLLFVYVIIYIILCSICCSCFGGPAPLPICSPSALPRTFYFLYSVPSVVCSIVFFILFLPLFYRFCPGPEAVDYVPLIVFMFLCCFFNCLYCCLYGLGVETSGVVELL